LFGFFFLAGLAISFSNYLDSNTEIRTSIRGVAYRSPIRKINFGWEQIRRLIATSSSRGWRVRVEGELGYFQFRSPSKVKVGNRGEMELGFKNGDRLIALILGSAQLDQTDYVDGSWVALHAKHKDLEPLDS
jgi:hypothetical protein